MMYKTYINNTEKTTKAHLLPNIDDFNDIHQASHLAINRKMLKNEERKKFNLQEEPSQNTWLY